MLTIQIESSICKVVQQKLMYVTLDTVHYVFNQIEFKETVSKSNCILASFLHMQMVTHYFILASFK